MRVRFGDVGTMAALLAGFLTAFGAAAVPAGAQDAPAVVTVRAREVPLAVTAFGVVHARQEAVLSAKVMARVEAIPLREGAAVKARDLLVALDHGDVDAALAAAEAARDRAAASLKEAEAEHARVKRLFDSGSATSREMERAESALSVAHAAHGEAGARVQEMRARKDYTRITAPFAGRLVERRVEVGELAAPGTPLVRVESTDGFDLWADVPQEWLPRVAVGADAVVRVDGVADPMPGTVARLVPAADPRSHTFTVKVALNDGADGADGVYSGMFGQVEVAHGTAPALVVPHTAIVRRAEVAGVYLAGDGARDLAFRLVRPGRRVGDDQVVESGLAPGDRVYVDGAGAARRRAAGTGR